jgi:hypothetical protein
MLDTRQAADSQTAPTNLRYTPVSKRKQRIQTGPNLRELDGANCHPQRLESSPLSGRSKNLAAASRAQLRSPSNRQHVRGK